tara:strand:+ start:117 stop:248 length:132 start_codon:yes stop_codon:yes gene_type:complete
MLMSGWLRWLELTGKMELMVLTVNQALPDNQVKQVLRETQLTK